MKNNLGQLFYDGRMINLNLIEEPELKEILSKVQKDKSEVNQQIETLLDKIMRNKVNEVWYGKYNSN